MKTLIAFTLLLLTTTAQAAVIGSCEGLDSIGNLVGSPKSFAQGAVRVAHVSTEEPAAAPEHLLIFVYGEEMSVSCAAVSAAEGMLGFGSIDMEKLTASYDPAKGLLLSVPVYTRTPDGERSHKEILKVRVNRKEYEPKVTLER